MKASEPRLGPPIGLSLVLLVVFAGLVPGYAHAESPFALVGRAGGATQTVGVQGDLAFMARGNVMTLLDVSDRSAPKAAGEIALPSALYQIVAHGDLVYVAAGFTGIHIVDVGDPAKPTLVGSFDTPDGDGVARDIFVSGNLAFVADTSARVMGGSSGSLSIVDVTDPSKPVEVGSFAAGASTNGVFAADGKAYVSTTKGLVIVDVADPAAPKEIAVVPTASTNLDHIKNYGGSALTYNDGHVYVADGYGGIAIIDVRKPERARHVGWYIVPYTTEANFTEADKGLGAAFGVAVQGGHAYVAAFNAGLRVVDVSNPGRPVEVSWQRTPLWAYQVVVEGDYAYVADYDGGLRIVDIRQPQNPREVGSYNPLGAGSYRHVEPLGNFVYVAAGAAGMFVIDVSDPAAPKVVGQGATPVFSYSVGVSGTHAYVADARSLRSFDVSDPTKPAELGSIEMSGQARSLTARGDFVYVGDDKRGLVIVDASDPVQLKVAGVLDTPGHARRVSLRDQHAFVGDELGGLRIVDVSDPTKPVEVGAWQEKQGPKGRPPFVWGAAVAGDYAYVIDGYYGMHVLDISDLTQPKLVTSFETPSFAWDAAVVDNQLLVGDSFSGLRAYDISNPANPVEVGVYDSPGVAWGVRPVGDLVYLGDGVCGMSILKRK